jgi:hypothetical protein
MYQPNDMMHKWLPLAGEKWTESPPAITFLMIHTCEIQHADTSKTKRMSYL